MAPEAAALQRQRISAETVDSEADDVPRRRRGRYTAPSRLGLVVAQHPREDIPGAHGRYAHAAVGREACCCNARMVSENESPEQPS